jgi:hypothetical protein
MWIERLRHSLTKNAAARLRKVCWTQNKQLQMLDRYMLPQYDDRDVETASFGASPRAGVQSLNRLVMKIDGNNSGSRGIGFCSN